jgi:putative transcriptional regulator
MNKGRKKVDSFRKQIAQSMADLDAIMKTGQSFSGDNRFTVRTIRVAEPGVYRPNTVRAVRKELGVSQAVFAQLLGVSQVLVRSWERGVREPAPIARRLLDVIRNDPQAATRLISTLPAGTARSTRPSTKTKRPSSPSGRASAA